MRVIMITIDYYDCDDDCDWYGGCDCDDKVLCRRINKIMMIMMMYVYMHVFLDISMYELIISFYRHIDYSI